MSDASLLEPGWREVHHQVGDVRLHAVEAGDPSGPLVILLHGFPEFWWTWHRVMPGLAAAGFHVLAPDQRGYNLSSVPRGLDAYGIDTLAEDVLALADVYGAERFHLVGHDWGAVIAWRVAALRPQRVKRLGILAGPHPDVWGRELRTRPTQALRSAYAGFFQIPALPERILGADGFRALRAMMGRTARPGAFVPGDLDRYAQAWANAGTLTGMLGYYRALRRPRRPAPERILPPTLILWGEHDAALGRGLARRSLARCDEGELRIVPGTSHWLQLEAAEPIAQELAAFLKAGRD